MFTSKVLSCVNNLISCKLLLPHFLNCEVGIISLLKCVCVCGGGGGPQTAKDTRSCTKLLVRNSLNRTRVTYF